jgi:simple sugar transport system permease protein
MNRFHRFLGFVRILWPVPLVLVIGACLIALVGRNPIEVTRLLIRGSILDEYSFTNTLLKMSPLILSGLAVVVPLRAGLYNIGGEGQMYLGGLTATLVAFSIPNEHPVVLIVACSLGGAIGGGVWAIIPALLKAYRGTSEVLVTLLMNYIALNLVNYMVSGPLLEPEAAYPYSKMIPEAARLPRLGIESDLHIGIIVGLITALAVAFIFYYTRIGAMLMIVGQNPRVAQYSGLSVPRITVGALAAGGAFAGLAGAYEILGLKYRLYHHFVSGYGTDGIVVAFLAVGYPLAVIPSAFVIAAFKNGAIVVQRTADVPLAVVEVLESLIVIFVAIALVLRQRRLRFAAPAPEHTNG